MNRMMSFENLMGAKVVNLRRLAKALGLVFNKWVGSPYEKSLLAMAITQWYNKHPVPKRMRRNWRIYIKNQSFRTPLIDEINKAGPLGDIAERINVRLFDADGTDWLMHPSWIGGDRTLFIHSRAVFDCHQYDLVDRAVDLRSTKFRRSEGLMFSTPEEQADWSQKQRDRLAYAELEF